MSYTATSLYSRVQNKLDDPSFDTAVLLDFLNDTEREVFNRYRINTQEQQIDTVTTTAGSRALTGLPGDAGSQTVGVYIRLRIILPVNYSRLLPYVEYEDADKFYPNYQLLGQGTPIAWFIFDGVPTLLNNADKVYTLSAKYTLNPTPITTGGDTPNLPEEFSEITVLGMYARALEFNDEYKEASAVRQQFTKLCTDYVDATRRTAGTPHVLRRPRSNNAPFGLR
jgi:hypothetical protein